MNANLTYAGKRGLKFGFLLRQLKCITDIINNNYYGCTETCPKDNTRIVLHVSSQEPVVPILGI